MPCMKPQPLGLKSSFLGPGLHKPLFLLLQWEPRRVLTAGGARGDGRAGQARRDGCLSGLLCVPGRRMLVSLAFPLQQQQVPLVTAV